MAGRETEEGGCITLHSLDAVETGYPYKVESTFAADDPWVSRIWNVSIRTAERCAGETYFDCPYYEQLQYVGDTRIQALISYYLGRDRALPRNAVETLGWSIMENGLTQSRYPSRQTQVIPPFSLWWVMMLYDQMLYDNSRSWSAWLASASQVHNTYRWLPRDGEFWQFGDWVPFWKWGVPPNGKEAEMHRLTHLISSLALISLHEAERHTDYPFSQPDADLRTFTPEFGPEKLLPKLAPYDKVEGLIHTKTEKVQPASEHAESLWRVAQAMSGCEVDEWPDEELRLSNAARATYYFSYYKHLAMAAASRTTEFDYLQELAPWKEQIEDGLTTFAENPEPNRSDCHAWSAHPILGFFQIVAGVTSIAPAWRKARIAPQPGSLKKFEANIAHPAGNLQITYENGKLSIDTPVPAELRWKGKVDTIEPGRHTV